jgi:hypothetical protein
MQGLSVLYPFLTGLVGTVARPRGTGSIRIIWREGGKTRYAPPPGIMDESQILKIRKYIIMILKLFKQFSFGCPP